ncbi:type II secretion system protein, partial [Campylobacter sp.]|uniref:type II secretion system protein n=1 Tax=Campylobacter sp. TaxID=205 RepID=UPI002AA6CEDF
VILGILASVAVPRLAGTKADAEESAAVANLRTLVSDLNTYYVATGDISGTTTWSEITNVPLNDATKKAGDDGVSLKVGGKECIDVKFVAEKAAEGTTAAVPAHIKFTKNGTNSSGGVCKKVLDSEPIKAYFASKVGSTDGAMPIGSNIKLER